MARPVFKKWWTRIIPKQIERSTFVLFTNLVLLLIFWQWQPIGSVVWQVQSPPAQLILNALFWFGFLLVLVSTFLINHFDLFGLRQVYLYAVGSSYIPLPFRTTGFYKLVRHPLLLGFIIAFWSTPLMTAGHLLFAGLTTAYMLIAIKFEEHDLENFHGEVYRRYRSDVPMLIPWKGAPGANLPRESAQNPASEN